VRRSGLALLAAGALCFTAGLSPLLVAGTAVAADEPGSGLGSFALNAIGTGVQFRVAEPMFCFSSVAAKSGCDGSIPEATSSLQSGPNGNALASVVWPGDLGANAGSLIVTASNGQAPDQLSMLDSPIRAERRTGQTPDTLTNNGTPPGATMKATAKSTSTSADAHVDSTSIPVGSFGPSSATSKTELTGPKSAISAATSNVSDIDLGVLHIGSVQSTATATTDGVTATAKGSTKVTGVTVAGIPVTIDENGITVQGTGVPLSILTNQVNAALTQAGISLLVSQPQGKPDGASVTYTSGALVVVFAPQAGYQFSVTLGQANVTAASVEAITFVPPTTGGTTGGTSTGGLSTGGTTTTGGGTSGGSGGGTSGSGGIAADPTTGGSVPGTAGGSTGSVPPPQTFTPETAAVRTKLGGGVSPWLGGFALVGVGLMAFGMKRLPDRVLEAVPSACPLEES
jgi:hypothetical protein